MVALAALAIGTSASVSGQTAGEGPQITYQNVHDGDVLAEHPYAFQFCFAEPVNFVTPDVDYEFGLETPEGIPFSQRTVFQPDGYGVTIYPGTDVPEIPPGLPTAKEQVWTFHYLVTAADDDATTEGEIHFTLDELATVIPHESTSACFQDGYTIIPTPTSAAARDDDGSGDTLLIGSVAAGVVVGMATVGGIVLMLRRRRRAPERPPE
jgi:hypothetical protein